MARSLVAVLCLALPGVCSASQIRLLTAEPEAQFCDEETQRQFTRASAVLRNDPGGLLQTAREVILSGASSDSMCLSNRNMSNSGFWVVIDEDFEGHNIAGCCTLAERVGMDVDPQGTLLPFSQAALGEMERGSLEGVDYLQIKPSRCTAAGCPLVVELTGNGGYPWLMVRNRCNLCREDLGVVMVAPVFPRFEDTSAAYVNDNFIPFVKALLKRTSVIVDPRRVYLVSASRGTEIALTAALGHPALFLSVLTTGKFRITPDLWDLVSTPGIYEQAANAGLDSIILNIGDKDPIFPDQEFYSNLTAALAPLYTSSSGPRIRLNIYPHQGHGTSPGVWTRWSSVIWSGTSEPWQTL